MADTVGAVDVEIILKGYAEVQAALDKVKAKLAETNRVAKVQIGGPGAAGLPAVLPADALPAAEPKGKKPASFLDGFADKLAGVKQVLRDLQQSIGKLGMMAQRGFLIGAAAAAAFAAQADQKGWDNLQLAIYKVSIQLGRVFIPLLHEVTGWITRLANFLDGLTDKQRSQVLHWVKVAGAVLLFVALAPKVIAALQMVVIGFRLFTMAITAVMASNPGGWLVTLIAVIGAAVVAISLLVSAVGMAADSGEGFGSAWSGVVDGFKRIWNQVATIFSTAWAKLGPAFSDIADVVLGVFTVIENVIAAVMPIISVALAQPIAMFNLLAAVIKMLWDVVEPVFGAITDALQVLGDIWNAVVPLMTIGIDLFKDAILALKPVFSAVFGLLQMQIMALVKTIIFAGTLIKNILKGNFTGAADEAAKAVEDFDKRQAGRENKKDNKDKKDKKDKEEDHQGSVRQQPSQLISIVEASRRMITSNDGTLEQKKLDYARRTAEGIEKQNGKKQEPVVVSGGGDFS